LDGYKDEVSEASPNAILLKEWNDLNAKRIGKFIIDKCQEGVIPLKLAHDLEFVTPQATLRPLSPKCEELLQTAKVLLVVETSAKTSPYFNEIRELLLQFVQRNVEGTPMVVGLMNYGSNVEVAIDIGSYESTEELEESIQDLHSIGGDTDSELAFETARGLFVEKDYKDSPKFIIIVHATELR
jgi:hypothetical protein